MECGTGDLFRLLMARPDGLEDVEHKCGGEAKQNPTVERFESAHHLPLVLQGNLGMTVAGQGVERVEHGIFSCGDCAQHAVGDGPHHAFTSKQGCAA